MNISQKYAALDSRSRSSSPLATSTARLKFRIRPSRVDDREQARDRVDDRLEEAVLRPHLRLQPLLLEGDRDRRSDGVDELPLLGPALRSWISAATAPAALLDEGRRLGAASRWVAPAFAPSSSTQRLALRRPVRQPERRSPVRRRARRAGACRCRSRSLGLRCPRAPDPRPEHACDERDRHQRERRRARRARRRSRPQR